MLIIKKSIAKAQKTRKIQKNINSKYLFLLLSLLQNWFKLIFKIKIEKQKVKLFKIQLN